MEGEVRRGGSAEEKEGRMEVGWKPWGEPGSQ